MARLPAITTPLEVPISRTYNTHMGNGQAALQTVLDRSPASIRSLAHAADLSEALLRAIRDGDRRLTADTREALVKALRERAGIYEELAETLDAVDLEPGGKP